MIKKVKHPQGRGERLAIKAKKTKKRVHDNASPVWKLLKEKEELDEDAQAFARLPRDRDTSDGIQS